MTTVEEASYGVVPFYKRADEWHVLLIEQHSKRGPTFWGFPKGHAEPGENEEAAALRELVEETGLKNVSLVATPPISTTYIFEHDNIKYQKTVRYFVGIASDVATVITIPEEIAGVRWVNIDEARTLLTHDNSRAVLHEALRYVA